MTERHGSYPPDEPVIGGSTPPAPPRQPGYNAGYAPAPGAPRYDEDWDEYADEYDEYDDGYDDDPYYDDEYYGEAPARQPVFYLFVAIAILVGAAAVVALFTLVRDDGGTEEAGTPGPVQFRVSVESPRNGDRVHIDEDIEVNVRATSTDPIARFELLVNGQVEDEVAATPPTSGSLYIQVLKTRFDRKGDYTLEVRVSAETGEQTTSDAIKVSAVEDIGDRPVSIRGEVVAAATLRTGPGEQFESAGTLNAGQEVTITGKTRNGEWLLLDIQGGRWAPAAAIDPLDSLDLVPVREPTPTPAPTNTPTREPSPTATPSVTPTPTANANAPDFVPQNAVLIDDGNGVRVTIANISPNNYSGTLVVRAEGIDAVSASQAFNVTLDANGATTVEFELATRITEQKTVTVRVDPENAVKEANEDNNTASIPLTPLAEAPKIVITDPVVGANTISVTVQNSGGDMPSSEVVVRLTLGEAETSQSKTISLSKNQTSQFTVARPQGNGTARVVVLVNGQQMAALDVPIAP
ncbi:MAG: SH3 domain-containing protein [Dehalococcoidia bacterium]|nr:SH3 domain-containing protein [Dehalococcoidia bacterium]